MQGLCDCPQDVHPFTFLDGQYSNELYDDAVRTNAQAFVGDESLKSKVGALARQMFADLETSALTAPYDEKEVEHKGVTFKVACGIRSRCVYIPDPLKDMPHLSDRRKIRGDTAPHSDTILDKPCL